MPMEKEVVKTFLRNDFSSLKIATAPIIYITPSTGRITFSPCASKLMGLRAGMYLAYNESSRDPRRIGFSVTDNPAGFAVTFRNNHNKSEAFWIISKPMVKHIAGRVDMAGVLHAQLASEPDAAGIWWVLEGSWIKVATSKRPRKDSER